MNHPPPGQIPSTTKGAVPRPHPLHRRSTTAVLIATLALLTSMIAVVAPTAASASTTAATPPFTHYPSAGASPTSAILVVINAASTVSVHHYPSGGTADGGVDS